METPSHVPSPDWAICTVADPREHTQAGQDGAGIVRSKENLTVPDREACEPPAPGGMSNRSASIWSCTPNACWRAESALPVQKVTPESARVEMLQKLASGTVVTGIRQSHRS